MPIKAECYITIRPDDQLHKSGNANSIKPKNKPIYPPPFIPPILHAPCFKQFKTCSIFYPLFDCRLALQPSKSINILIIRVANPFCVALFSAGFHLNLAASPSRNTDTANKSDTASGTCFIFTRRPPLSGIVRSAERVVSIAATALDAGDASDWHLAASVDLLLLESL